jgi:hypothetical protein
MTLLLLHIRCHVSCFFVAAAEAQDRWALAG